MPVTNEEREALPHAVVATRSDPGLAWSIGARRRWTDGSWLLRTVRPDVLLNGHTVEVRFDSPIAPGMTLADPARGMDAAVKRKLVARAVSDGFGDGPLAAPGCAAFASRFDWILRWRVDVHEPGFAALAEGDFHAFVGRLRGGDLMALVDWRARLACWSAAVSAGSLVVPATAGLSLPEIDVGALAMQFGVTRRAVASSGEFRAALLLALSPWFPECADALAAAAEVAAAEPPPRSSASRLLGYLDAWRHLRRASELGILPDALAFDPFRLEGPRHLASRFGSDGSRTRTLSPETSFRLLRAATHWLLERGPALVTEMGTMPAPAGDALDAGIRLMMAACAILIGFLAGRRGGEVRGLRSGRVREPRPGVFEIDFYIEKTIQDLDRVAVPSLAVVAVRTLEAMSLLGRAADGGDGWLFRMASPTGRTVEFDPSGDMRAFVAACGLDAGTLPDDLASHQLRRGFSVTFHYAYRLGTLDALCRQLRHADLRSTTIYVTEVEAGGLVGLRDACDAAHAIALASMGEAQRRWLTEAKRRLVLRRARGVPFDEATCEAAVQVLLRAWPGDGGPAAAGRRITREAPTGIRIGSQAVPSAGGMPLLAAVREYVAALDACVSVS